MNSSVINYNQFVVGIKVSKTSNFTIKGHYIQEGLSVSSMVYTFYSQIVSNGFFVALVFFTFLSRENKDIEGQIFKVSCKIYL